MLQLDKPNYYLLGQFGTNAKDAAEWIQKMQLQRQQAGQQQQSANIDNQYKMGLLQQAQAEAAAKNSPTAQASAEEDLKAKKLANIKAAQDIGFDDQANPIKLGKMSADLDTTQDNNTMKKLEFIGNKYRGVTTKAQLEQVNNLAKKTGLFDDNQLPTSVGESRLYYEGSKMHMFDLQQEAKQQEWDRQTADRIDKQKYDMAMTVMQARQKQAYAMQLEQERSKLGLSHDVNMAMTNSLMKRQEMEYAGKVLPNLQAQQAVAGAVGANPAQQQQPLGVDINGNPLANINGQVVQPRAAGGPINQGQPYLVGEQGPELVVPQQNAQVIPADQTAQMMQQPQQMADNSQLDAGQYQQILDSQADPLNEPPPDNQFNQSAVQRADSVLNKAFDEAMNPTANIAAAGSSDKPPPGFTPAIQTSVTKMNQGKAYLDTVKKYVFNPDGSVNRKNLTNAAWNTPFTDGRTLNSMFSSGLEGDLRIATGAAIQDSEVERMATMYRPSPLDNDFQIRAKMHAYEDLLKTLPKLVEGGKPVDVLGEAEKGLADHINREYSIDKIMQQRSGYTYEKASKAQDMIDKIIEANPNYSQEDAIQAMTYYKKWP